MKLSQETINILKHAAGINPGILIDEGSDIFAVHESKTVRMQAKIEEEFPNTFALVNLNQFLNTISLIDDPELTFQDDHVVITSPDGTQKVQYYFSDPNVVNQSNKRLKADIEYEFSFEVTKDELTRLGKAAATIGADDVMVYNDGANIYMAVLDKRRQAGNEFNLLVGSNSSLEGKEYRVFFRKGNLKLTGNDFHVDVSSRGISTWTAKDSVIPELLFYVAIERDSSFGTGTSGESEETEE